MRNILNTAIGIFSLLSLSACYHPDIQQGNQLNDSQIKQLHNGMSKQEVVNLLGEPVLQNLFDANTLTYVYTNNPNRGHNSERKVILHFTHNALDHISDTGLVIT